MNKKIIAVIGLGSLLVASVAGAQMVRGGYDEPAHEVLHEEKRFEIRRYEPRIVAQTVVRASSLSQATSPGFGRLADYIFGGNEGSNGESMKIAMTTPVESAPVGEGEYKVIFTMPPEHTMADLPAPNDARVEVREVPAQTVATVRFSGVARNKDVGKMREALLDYVDRQGYVATSDVAIAQYDPPWTPGFLRRNELMVDIARKN